MSTEKTTGKTFTRINILTASYKELKLEFARVQKLIIAERDKNGASFLEMMLDKSGEKMKDFESEMSELEIYFNQITEHLENGYLLDPDYLKDKEDADLLYASWLVEDRKYFPDIDTVLRSIRESRKSHLVSQNKLN
jgi:hypothetical protein